MSFDVLCESISQCRRCDLCVFDINVNHGKLLPSKGPKKILFLGINPSCKRFEDSKTAFVSRTSGYKMDLMMKQTGLEKSDYYWDNLVHCSTPENREPTEKEIDCCHAYLTNLIQSENIKLVVCLGALVSKYFDVEIGKIKRIKVSDSVDCGVVYFTALKHPAWVSYNNDNRAKYLEDLHSLKGIIDVVFNTSKITSWG